MKMKIFLAKSGLGERKYIRVKANIMERNLLENLQLVLRSSRAVKRNYARTTIFLSVKLLTGRFPHYYVNNCSFSF